MDPECKPKAAVADSHGAGQVAPLGAHPCFLFPKH